MHMSIWNVPTPTHRKFLCFQVLYADFSGPMHQDHWTETTPTYGTNSTSAQKFLLSTAKRKNFHFTGLEANGVWTERIQSLRSRRACI